MDLANVEIFQISHPLILEQRKQSNFKCLDLMDGNTCVAVYFSSNDIYFPNDEKAFSSSILEGDKYEWYRTRVNRANRHVFVRDVYKQWYLEGISDVVNSTEKLKDLLKKLIDGFQEVYFIGSSAGGFAAIYYGNLLGVNKVLTFNAQLELASLAKTTRADVNPIVHKKFNENSNSKELKALSYVNKTTLTIYCYSFLSGWDREQAKNAWSIRKVVFLSFKHGIPFAKGILSDVINNDIDTLFSKRHWRVPLIFGLRIGGITLVLRDYLRMIKKGFGK